MSCNIGCLIIHGFAGSIQEVAPAAEYLLKKGYKVICAQLKGHTGKRRDLARSNYIEWIQSAQDSYMRLCKECDRVVIIGFSMGGLVAVNLALHNPVQAIALVNTPVYFWDIKRIGLNVIEDISNCRLNNLSRYTEACFDKPLMSLLNFLLLLVKTKGCFKKVNCPVYIGQSLNDDVVQFRSADYIYEKVIVRKHKKYYRDSGHVIFHSNDKKQVCEDIKEFIESVA